jgi:hypothetical protein
MTHPTTFHGSVIAGRDMRRSSSLSERVLLTSIEAARRLAVTKQRLAEEVPRRATRERILSVVRDLCYVQWDPIDAVAPSHVIALWSRIGSFRRSDLDGLLWDEKRLFLHWFPIASIVLTEDYPLYASMMRRYPESLSKSWGGQMRRARTFLAAHQDLRKRILRELEKGPLQLNEFEDYIRTKRGEDGWTSGSEVSAMLNYLQMSGEVMVVGHRGNKNVWGLPDTFLPDRVKEEELTEDEFERQAAQRAIRALGTASPREIHYYFPRGRYRNLTKTLERLQEDSIIHRVQVTELGGRDERYVHEMDVQLLESMRSDAWQQRMTLLAPFDNLICSTGRTDRLFGFHYIHENFLPPGKRKFGTFVHPILWGERLIGRVDLEMDKTNEKLVAHSVHAEPRAPAGKEVSVKIRETIENLAEFVGAKEVVFSPRVPTAWKTSLR